MNTQDVIFARIYMMESQHELKNIMNYLKNDAKIKGITVFRAIEGFGETGDHSTRFMDLSLDLPLTIEFFDVASKMTPILEHLNSVVKSEHIVFWDAKKNTNEF